MLLFLPYRAQIKLHKLPVVTLAIIVLCLAIYYAQYRNEQAIWDHAQSYCAAHNKEGQEEAFFRNEETCTWVMVYLHTRVDRFAVVDDAFAYFQREHGDTVAETFRNHYWAFAKGAPRYLTAQFWQRRPSFDPGRMVTGTFAHADWEHVIGNVIFFFAFAAAVELILGPVLFAAVVLVMAFGIGTIDSLTYLGQPMQPSLGLSGVVTGMLALLMYFAPRVKVSFFFWFILSIGSIGLPAWLVGLWYIGWDAYYNLASEFGYINYTAHLAGAALGLILGITVFRRKRHWAQALLFEEEDLTQEQGFFRKLNAYLAAPGVAGFAVLAYLFAIILIVRSITVHWLQVLMIAPIAAALWQLYRMKKADRPDWQRYQEALATLDQGRGREAAQALEALARRGYVRAQYTLATLYTTGRGVLKDLQRATHWLAQAAARGHAHALNDLAARYLDGRGVPQDVQKALDCYGRAAAKGIAQAAFSLGYLHETGRADQKRDKESAAQWYYQAGVLSLKDRDLKGAQSALLALNALQADHPLSRKLLQAEPGLAGG